MQLQELGLSGLQEVGWLVEQELDEELFDLLLPVKGKLNYF